jgi:hypothetical protein
MRWAAIPGLHLIDVRTEVSESVPFFDRALGRTDIDHVTLATNG